VTAGRRAKPMRRTGRAGFKAPARPLARSAGLSRTGGLARTGTLTQTGQLAQTGALARTGELARTGRIAPRSKKTAEVYATVRVPLVVAYLAEHPWCQIKWDSHCNGRAEGLHEVLSRGRGGSITDKANGLAACHYCNGAVSDHPAEAEDRGFLVKSGRPSKAVPRKGLAA